MAPHAPLGFWEFARYEGLGNDYLLVDAETFGTPFTPALAAWMCDRHRGVGSDGVLVRLARRGDGAHGLRIFNPDGSQAEKSGNGLRIFARFLRDFGYAPQGPIIVDTPGGRVVAALKPDAGPVESITVAMGKAVFDSAALHATGPARSFERQSLNVDGEVLDMTAVSMGNPHCVIFGASMDVATLRRLGPKIERHALFPKRINVQLAQVTGRRSLQILIWERGAGETFASGSSSCAAASAAVKRGLMDADAPLVVSMPGGELTITVARNWAVTLSGPAEPICRGSLLRLPADLSEPS